MRIYWALVLSLFIHFLFQIGINQLRPLSVSKRDTVEVDFISPPNPTPDSSRFFVKDLPSPNEVPNPTKSKIRFWSLQNKFVKEEQRTQNIGVTQNKLGSQTQSQKTSKPQEASTEEDGLSQASRELKQISQGSSSISQELPKDIKIGAFTSLNTQYSSHYSFFSRIEDLIYLRWVERIQRSFETLEGKVLPYNRDGSWVTDVDIILDKNGFYKTTRFLKSSQIRAFDEAILESFKEVSLFPNPPQSLVEEDGFIHLKYKFNVKYSPRQVVSK